MSNKRITILLVLLFLLVSGVLPKMAAVQTALAQELKATSPLPSSIAKTLTAISPEATVSVISPTQTETKSVAPVETKIVPPKTSSGSTLFTTRNLIVAFGILLFVFCLVLLLLLRSLRLSKKKQSLKKIPGSPQSLSKPHGLRLVLASGGEIAINKLPASIGRDKQKSDIVLRDDSISAIHANLYYNPSLGKICIEDCSSLNGVFVNERPTRKNVLEDGAIIKLGDTLLTFRDTGFIPSDQS
jgi:hypothetical protein